MNIDTGKQEAREKMIELAAYRGDGGGDDFQNILSRQLWFQLPQSPLENVRFIIADSDHHSSMSFGDGTIPETTNI